MITTPQTEVERLLGTQTYNIAEQQFEQNAHNPNNQAKVLAWLDKEIAAGHIDSDGETARAIRAAIDGQWFQQLEKNGVCMDDVTQYDR